MLTDEQKAAYLDALRNGQRRLLAARACRVEPMDILAESQADADFARAIVLAEMEADDEVEDALRTAAISGNVTAAMKWLVNRRPDRWSDQKMNVLGSAPSAAADSLPSGDEGNDRMAEVRYRARLRTSHRHSAIGGYGKAA